MSKLAKPRAVWLMVPAAVVDSDASHALAPLLEPGDIIIDGGNSYYIDDIRRAKELAAAEDPLRRRRHQRRRVGPRARLLHDDRRPEATVQRLDPIFKTLAPGTRRHRPHARAREDRRHGRAGLPALRAERRRPLRQDGPQRHRVRHHGRVRRGPRHPARPPTSASETHAIDAETTPLRDPEHYQYDLNLPDIAEVWRRGSVIASWLLDLTARRCSRIRALRTSPAACPTRAKAAGRSRPRSTRRCPSPVLTTALYERFSSRGEADFQNKLLSAMRFEFGGHVEKQHDADDEPMPLHSDALVFFGATGDLAYKKIFPSLQAMVKRGHLNVPVIGVAKPGWTLDQLRARARDSLEKHGGARRGGVRQAAGAPALRRRRLRRRRDVPGAAQGARRRRSTRRTTSRFRRCCSARSSSSSPRPAARNGARVIVEKPFGHDLASARRAQRASCTARSTRRTSSASTTTSASGRCTTCCSSASPTRSWSRSGTANTSRACRSRWPRTSACRAAARSTTQTGTDPRRRAEPPLPGAVQPRDGAAGAHRQRVDARREGQGAEVDPHARARATSCAASSAATCRSRAWRPTRRSRRSPRCKLALDSWRWQGVPFYIRAGKYLPVTCTEVMARFRRPPTLFPTCAAPREPRPVPHQPRGRDRARRDGDGQRARRFVGKPVELLASAPPDRRRDGRLRARAGRRDGRRRDAVRARGLRRGSVAHRRSGARCQDAGLPVRHRPMGAPAGCEHHAAGWLGRSAGQLRRTISDASRRPRRSCRRRTICRAVHCRAGDVRDRRAGSLQLCGERRPDSLGDVARARDAPGRLDQRVPVPGR